MFWGLTLESGKRYAQQVETSFHISMAALDVRTCGNGPVAVSAEVAKNDYIMCTLDKSSTMQQALDLNFMKGDYIAFAVNGKGTVHLTGFIIPTEEEFEDMEDMEEEEMSDEEVPQLQHVKDEKKRKGGAPESKLEPVFKKSKVLEMNGDADSDESDDDDFDMEGEEDDDDEASDEEVSGLLDDEADDEELDEEGEEGEEDEDDSDEDEESEEEETPAVAQKKQKTPQNQQQKTPQNQKQKTPQNQKQKTPQNQQQKSPQQQQQQQKTPNKDQKKTNGAATPKEQSAKKGDKNTPKQSPKDSKTPGTPGVKKTLQGGVIVEDLSVGNGPAVSSGRQAAVYYIGRNKHNNKQFDATQTGPPFKFRLGKGEVIKGWDIGVQGMKVGGKRRVICPPHMAYGNKGAPPAIPPNSTLVFDIELKGVS